MLFFLNSLCRGGNGKILDSQDAKTPVQKPKTHIKQSHTSPYYMRLLYPDCCEVLAIMGGRHHQKYKDVKQISKYKAGLKISCRIEQLIKEWHDQIIDGLVFLHETEHPKHEQLSQMINGLEIEIAKWTSSITNSLALICNTVHKRCSVASNGSG